MPKVNKKKFIIELQQYGLILGCAAFIGGVILSVPPNVQDWRTLERTNHIMGFAYKNTIHLKRNQEIPQEEAKTGKNSDGYKMISIVFGNPAFVFAGSTLAILGSLAVKLLGDSLSEKFELIETKQWNTYKREELLQRTEDLTNLEVDRTAIEVTGMGKILHLTSPANNYLGEDDEPPEEPESEQDNSLETFCAWIWGIEEKTKKATFTIRELSFRTFDANRTPPRLSVDELKDYVDKMIAVRYAKWDNEKKSQFTLVDLSTTNTQPTEIEDEENIF